jgi:PAS domain S-box-containing protein
MIVEDEVIVGKDIQASLESLGYCVTSLLSSGEQALERIEQDSPDLVLMDIVLKGEMDGIEAARRIVSRFDIPIVYLTAYSDLSMLKRAKMTEPFGYLLKPFDSKELRSTIEIALHKARKEKELRRSEERLRILADSTYDWESWCEPSGKCIYVSPSCEVMTGYSREDFYNDPRLVEKITYPDDRERIAKHLGEELATREVCHIDFRIVCRDGRQRWIYHTCQPVFAQDGSFLGRHANNRDVTGYKLAEEALRESEEFHRAALGNVSDAVFLTDATGAFIYVSGNVAGVFGYSEEEVYRLSNVAELLGQGLLEPAELGAPAGGRSIEREVTDSSGNRRFLRVNVRQVAVKGGTLLYTCSDVTLNKLMEEVLEGKAHPPGAPEDSDRPEELQLGHNFRVMAHKEGSDLVVEGVTEELTQAKAFITTEHWQALQADDRLMLTVFIPPSFSGQDKTIGLRGQAVVTEVDGESGGVGVRFLLSLKQFEPVANPSNEEIES